MENLNTGQAVFKSINAPGFPSIELIGTLPRLYKQEECIFMLLPNRQQFLSLCTVRKKFYTAILLSFEVALMSVPACI